MKVVVFEDRLGFISGPSNISIEITKEDGTVLQPEEEIEVNVGKEEWEKIQKEETFEKVAG